MFTVKGHVDTPLNDFGEKQAQAVGKALKNVAFHQAFTSDLKRAFKTCQLILDENEMTSVKTADIVQDIRIKEQNFGNYENVKLSDFIAEAMKANINPYEFAPETMENGESVRKRSREFFIELISKVPNKTLYTQLIKQLIRNSLATSE